MTIKLSDLQLILLSHAAGRSDGVLLPLPEQVAAEAARTKRAIATLLKRDLLHETDVRNSGQVWREEDDRRIGLVITDAGLAAIGVTGPDAGTEDGPVPAATPPAEADSSGVETLDRGGTVDSHGLPTPPTKRALVLDMLQREQGATLDELVQATGWLAHTTRAALTGLRKKGFAILREKADGISRYRIAGAA